MSASPLADRLSRFLQEHHFQPAADLPWGKRLFQSADGLHFAKASSDPKGVALIRSEANGFNLVGPLLSKQFSIPRATLLYDEADGVAIQLTRVEGSPVSPWRAPRVELTKALSRAKETVCLSALLEAEQVDESTTSRLLERFGDTQVPVTPSHGDMIYWNVLVGGPQPGLIDFEYASSQRVAGFDDLHYRFAPWMLRWMRWRLPAVPLIVLGKRYAAGLCQRHQLELEPRLLLALFFIHWSAIQRHWHTDFEPFRIILADEFAIKC